MYMSTFSFPKSYANDSSPPPHTISDTSEWTFPAEKGKGERGTDRNTWWNSATASPLIVSHIREENPPFSTGIETSLSRTNNVHLACQLTEPLAKKADTATSLLHFISQELSEKITRKM